MTTHQHLPILGAAAAGCDCGDDSAGLPELDARLIPHAIRHGAVIGAFQQLPAGQAMALVAPHNPLPLLKQLRSIFGEQIEVSYLVEGPEAWKLRLAKA